MDNADSDSIILTREQYRQLLPQGERQAALESLKMLLASRPVVYLGFGLRDPDFIYLRDLLANTYKGGIRDHFAIMADVSADESDYWRRNYGIHLVKYNTVERPDKTRDHKELLALLDIFRQNKYKPASVVDFEPCSPQVILALARHAAGLSRTPKINPEFQIRVHTDTKKQMGNGTYYYNMERFEHYTVNKFLDEGPERALLIGLPGSGKTYSLRQATSRLAEKLHEICLSDLFNRNIVVIPILVDLKLYRGNLSELVSQTLPESLPFKEIIKHFNVKIFFDSFNEIPREYWERGSYEYDFEEFFKYVGQKSIIVCSRTSDGLDKLQLPVYYLDQIDEETVATELHKLGIESFGAFDREIRQLLQRPFYFQYIRSGRVRFNKEARPRDFYQAFFENLCKEFNVRFSKQIDIQKVLALVAYNALDMGEEAFLLSGFLEVLKIQGEVEGLTDIDARDIANWLVANSVLIPYTGGRVAFVHQSVTEYLAASELARYYQENSLILMQKLKLTRWDQALFLTLSLLPPNQGEKFLEDVMKADFVLALNAAKYIENRQEEIVSKLIAEIPNRIMALGLFNFGVESAIEYGLPLSVVHEKHLHTLIKCGDSIGAVAVRRLVALKGEEVKDEMLQLLLDHRTDYNLCCNGIAAALSPFATENDVKKIVSWADSINNEVTDTNDDDIEGFISGAAAFLSRLDLLIIRREFLLQNISLNDSKIHIQIVCDILRDHHSTAALDFAGDLLLMGVPQAAVAIYFISRFAEEDLELSWASYTVAHVDSLEAILYDGDESWALNALVCLCSGRPDLAEIVRQRAIEKSGIRKAALLYCVAPDDFSPVFQAIEELIAMCEEKRREQPIQILKSIDFDWTGKEELFVNLLKLRDKRIASALFGGSCPPQVENLGEIEIGSIEFWLEWMLEVLQVYPTNESHWFVNQLARLFEAHLSREAQDMFVAEFNRSDSKFRRLILWFILPCRSDITTDEFNEEAISFVLDNLSRERHNSHISGSFLGCAATDRFVTETILPLLTNAKSPLLENLKEIVKQAGSRHGKRYVFESLPELDEFNPLK